MTPYADKKPRYVREWYLKLKRMMKEKFAIKQQEEARKIQEEEIKANLPVVKEEKKEKAAY